MKLEIEMRNMEQSRTKNSAINFGVGALSQVINIVMSFITRTIFIYILGVEYLSINGLFTNILTILSFAELGIGNAIIYNMYRPIANQDTEKIKSLMTLYRKVYFFIGVIVFLLGILIIPFFPYVIRETPNIKESLIIIYLLFLLNTSASYFFSYKRSIIMGYQQEYIINIYKIVFYILRNVAQIIFLLFTKDFILYLILQVVFTFIENVAVSMKANRMFPLLKEKNVKALEKKELKTIFSHVKALMTYKVGSVVLNGTDNIIISSIIGLTAVGIISNYTLIITAVVAVASTALTGFTGSVGNLNVSNDKKKKEDIFYDLLFISSWILGFCSIAILLLVNDFITVWVGKEYIVSTIVVVSLILHVYVNGMQFAGYTYRLTSGLFEKMKANSLIAALVNIVLSIILGKIMGLAGIFFATSITRLLTTTWVDVYLVNKYELDGSNKKYWYHYVKYTIAIIAITFVCRISTRFIIVSNYGWWILKAMMVSVIFNICFFILFKNTRECKEIKEKVKFLIQKKKIS